MLILSSMTVYIYICSLLNTNFTMKTKMRKDEKETLMKEQIFKYSRLLNILELSIT